MTRFLAIFLLLLIPILIILIVRVRRRQRILYTHTFLRPLKERPWREFLLRSFQLYYDVAFDLVLALLLALFLSGLLDLSPRRTAVCLDGSFSMVQGQPQSPLDRALAVLAGGDLQTGRFRLFYCGFDPQEGRHILTAVGSFGRAPSVRELREQIRSLPLFFSSNPRILGQLFRRGYRRVIYLTDRFDAAASGLEVVELGESRKSFFYPLSGRYQPEEGSFRIQVLRHGHEAPIRVWRFNEQKQSYTEVYIIQPEASGNGLAEIEMEDSGLYKLSAAGLDFLLPLEQQTLLVKPQGKFSTMMAELLPGLVLASEGVPLVDLPYDPKGEQSLRRSLGGRQGIITLIPAAQSEAYLRLEPHLHSLRDSLSQPAFAELPAELLELADSKSSLFFIDPQRLREPGTPLVYLSRLWRQQAPGPLLEPGALPAGARLSRPRSGSTSFAYKIAERTVVVNLPPEEFFPIARTRELLFPSPRPQPLAPALLLLLLYLLKLLFLARLHGARRSDAGSRRPDDWASPR